MITLYDVNKDLCNEWEEEFKDIDSIEIVNKPFKDIEATHIVTAGNSFGWMTGGIDLAVRDYYGVEIQDAIQSEIIGRYNGELPIGKIIVVYTDDTFKPNLVYIPTMRIPQRIKSIDVFYCFYNLLGEFGLYGDLAVCGLGTGTGEVSAKECAYMMRKAYDLYVERSNYIYDSKNK